MSYTKNRNSQNFHARVKKEWKRAEKKRRISERKQTQAVAKRLLGVLPIPVSWSGGDPYYIRGLK